MGALMTLAAFIWGTTFVAQSAGMRYIGPVTFIAVRSLIAAAALYLCALLLRRGGYGRPVASRKRQLLAGLACGAALFLSTLCQQIGMVTTTAGKAGFITSLYIIIVPVLRFFMRKRVPPVIWLCVLIATAGTYLLSVTESLTVSRGDFFVLLCAVFFSGHILIVDAVSRDTDPVMLCCMQFAVCAALGIPAMFAFERPHIAGLLAAAVPILYSAVLSGGVAYTIQIIAQRYVEPAKASLMMCLESVFALLAGWVVLGERLSAREAAGCLLVFAAMLLSVWPRKAEAGAVETVGAAEVEAPVVETLAVEASGTAELETEG